MPKAFKTIEVLALEMNIAGKELLILGINRTPKANSAGYFLKLDLFMWSTTLKHHVVVVGYLNLESGQKRGKIVDLSEGNLQFQMSIGLNIRGLHQPRKHLSRFCCLINLIISDQAE